MRYFVGNNTLTGCTKELLICVESMHEASRRSSIIQPMSWFRMGSLVSDGSGIIFRFYREPRMSGLYSVVSNEGRTPPRSKLLSQTFDGIRIQIPTKILSLVGIPKVQMVITKIIAILALQPPIPFTSISALILPPTANNKDSRSYSADSQEPKTHPEPSRVFRTFARNVYVARGDASKIADTNHHRGRDGPLVIAAALFCAHAITMGCATKPPPAIRKRAPYFASTGTRA